MAQTETHRDNLMGFVDDAWIAFPICVAVIAGGLGCALGGSHVVS